MKLGFITVGQSPREDVTRDIGRIFDDSVEIMERGALDHLSLEEIHQLEPKKGDYILVSRLADNTPVTLSQREIEPRLQSCIDDLEDKGAQWIVFLCTGEFPLKFKSKVPLIFPDQILGSLVPILSGENSLIVVIPWEQQGEQAKKKWERHGLSITAISASPYGELREIEDACPKIKESQGNLVVLDCIGYSQKMKNMVAEKTQKNVILPRTLLARVISELADKGKG